MSSEFMPPEWTAAPDIEQRLAQLPEGAVARGMFFQSIIDTVVRITGREPEHPRYIAFMEYPLSDFIALVEQCAKLAFPNDPFRQAARRFGQDVYPMFSQTMAGRAIFSIAARDWHKTLRLSSKAFGVSIKPGEAKLVESMDNHAIIALRGVWSFPDCYQVGIFEGAMQLFRLNGTIRVRVLSLCDVDLHISW